MFILLGVTKVTPNLKKNNKIFKKNNKNKKNIYQSSQFSTV